eukprot:2315390-Ditylum_brightwellii.AAC.1
MGEVTLSRESRCSSLTPPRPSTMPTTTMTMWHVPCYAVTARGDDDNGPGPQLNQQILSIIKTTSNTQWQVSLYASIGEADAIVVERCCSRSSSAWWTGWERGGVRAEHNDRSRLTRQRDFLPSCAVMGHGLSHTFLDKKIWPA